MGKYLSEVQPKSTHGRSTTLEDPQLSPRTGGVGLVHDLPPLPEAKRIQFRFAQLELQSDIAAFKLLQREVTFPLYLCIRNRLGYQFPFSQSFVVFVEDRGLYEAGGCYVGRYA